jgi:exodeoxyribonuclease III
MTKDISIYSWNINGLRAVYKKGFIDWLIDNRPYIICLQEIKTFKRDLSIDLIQPKGYYAYWNCALSAGYSGTAILSKEEPLRIRTSINHDIFDEEGRILIAEYPDFTLINCYVPNGRPDHSRVELKIEFFHLLLEECKKYLLNDKSVIICGDFNVAHTDLDLSNPKANKNKTGFLLEERLCIDRLIENGFSDVLRLFFPNVYGKYTWWNTSGDFKEKNLGWRFDYFFVSNKIIKQITSTNICHKINISDHCPINLNIITQNAREEYIKKDEAGYMQERLF